MDRRKKRLITLAGLALLILVIWWAQANLNSYTLRILNLAAINIICAMSLNLLFGFTGQFSLGHAGFMAVGAYVTGLLILPEAAKANIFILDPLAWPFTVLSAPFLVALLAGGAVAALIAVVIGFPVLRLRGDYLGIATLGFAEIVRVLANNLTTVTNGALGLKDIPPISNLWWTVGGAVIAYAVIKRIITSSYGRAFMAIRENEVAAEAMGVSLVYYKTLSFAVSAFFAGVGGGLMASLLTTINPRTFVFMLTFNILIMVVVGGLGSLTGSIVAGLILTVIMEALRPLESPMVIFGRYIPGIPGMRMVIFAIILLIAILFLKQGIFGQRELDLDAMAGLYRKARARLASGQKESGV